MAVPFIFHWYVSGAVPDAITENVAVWPARMDTLTGCATIKGATATPVPLRETENVELSWALEKEALPEVVPVAAGAKLAVKVTLFPGSRLTGRVTPLRLNPAPETVA